MKKGKKKVMKFEGEKDLGGRPKEGNRKYGTDKNPFGRDPLGAKANRPTKSNGSSLVPKYKGGSPLAKENKELMRVLKNKANGKIKQYINK